MSYLVLARKWRPQTFADLVGQDHVRRTLANAIAQNRVAHAFLFTGVRGVGKTTSARILAKALSCESGPTAEPCLKCDACVGIAAGTDVDVQEIDGASYNGVDEVRRLQETLPYRPQRDRFKIFIIDEVHMLSSSAWNAFLKTLEEPPPHVKFIFATTEVHRVPVTILSRCQRYDFKMISAQAIAARLRYVLAEEKIRADDAAVNLVAREASGSMRDAMSLLDQAIAWGGDALVGEEVAGVLGVASRTVVHRLVTALVEGAAEACLREIAGLVEQGYDLTRLARDVLAHLRDLVVAKVCATPGPLLDLADDEAAAVRALSDASTSDDLVRLHQGFSRAYDDIARSAQPRAALEMTFVRLARRPPLVPLDELVGRLADIERRLGTARVSGGGGAGGGGASGVTRSATRPASTTTPTGSTARALPPPTRITGPTVTPGGFAPEARSGHASGPVRQGAVALASPVLSLATEVPIAPARREQLGPRDLTSLRGDDVAAARVAAPDAPGRRTSPSSGPPRSNRATGALGMPDPSLPLPSAPVGVDIEAWTRIVNRVRESKPALGSVLENAAPLAVSAQRVVLAFAPDSFLAAQASEPTHADLLNRAVRAELGEDAAVSIELSPDAQTGLTVARINAVAAWQRRQKARAEVENHPLVLAAIEVLGAELRDVTTPEDG